MYVSDRFPSPTAAEKVNASGAIFVAWSLKLIRGLWVTPPHTSPRQTTHENSMWIAVTKNGNLKCWHSPAELHTWPYRYVHFMRVPMEMLKANQVPIARPFRKRIHRVWSCEKREGATKAADSLVRAAASWFSASTRLEALLKPRSKRTHPTGSGLAVRGISDDAAVVGVDGSLLKAARSTRRFMMSRSSASIRCGWPGAGVRDSCEGLRRISRST
mmetsp:Transcript_73996/g.190942  ORF Transcript_73996/g.190942 Transcript_73996/m.190942 type:complete len:216 (+) Transcript_73996:755-1402(+)